MPHIPFANKTDRHIMQKKLIGVYMDKDISSYLTLYALWKDKDVSKVLRSMINRFITKNKRTKEGMLFDIAKKAHDEWMEWYELNKAKNIIGYNNAAQVGNRWEEYKEQCTINLKRRKIPVKIIDAIIQNMEKLEIERT